MNALIRFRRLNHRKIHSKVNLLDLSKESLTEKLRDVGITESYRASQILQSVYSQGKRDFNEILQLPKDMRKILIDEFDIGSMETVVEQTSKDGTIKRAYRLKGGQEIEAVLMPYRDGRFTACVSSQAGCGMGCVFCATGQMGFARQLTATEIFEQAAIYSCELRARGKRLSNVVLMGMVCVGLNSYH